MPGWLLLIAGIVIGGFGMMLTELAPNVGMTPGAKSTTVNKEGETEAKGPVFDFYTLLPESEVLVPSEKKTDQQKPPVKKTVTKSEPEKSKTPYSEEQAKSGHRYLLQAGSFRSAQDADRLRAQLILTGFEARIEKVKVRGGEQWHRVQLGPFNSETEVRAVRQQLASQGLETMLLQQR
ncbi:SPOR domain-containing protein [Parendozoicomonas sp. Alg238-R29]|uniref:SPOR domain-containing protein n=1 Tax=Parendozoicomonas sp. Alg238-R29 TaxID=2993446 RepID=UPI00248DB3FA|nr:SPOR domain-containing protein [Parendozoicomonas sp. Alg238-R29]